MYRQAAFLVSAVAAGVLIGTLGASTRQGDAPSARGSAEASAAPSGPEMPQAPSDAPDGDLAAAVDSLTEILNAEINERRILTEQVQQLQSEIRSLKRMAGVDVETVPVEAVSYEGESENTVGQTREARLSGAGFTTEEIALIENLETEAQMAGIALDDRARREGWINTSRYMEEAQNLPTGPMALRDVLGDDRFDQYLIASGYPNRIAVGSVIDGSPAANAGFRMGDVIVTYAGEKVYSARQLIDLRSSGQLGEPVAVEIRRNGQLLQLTIPRGPMGMAAMPTRFDPASTEQ